MWRVFSLFLALLTAVGCAAVEREPAESIPLLEIRTEETDARFLEELRNTDPKAAAFVTAPFLDYLREECGISAYRKLYLALTHHLYTPALWHAATGRTALVLYDEYSGALDPDSPSYRPDILVMTGEPSEDGITTVCVVGDVSFADNYEVMAAMRERGRGLSGVLSEEVVSTLRSADILLVNSEFAFTDRGTPTPRKMYTFRGSPENVRYLLEMGTDIVTLANNHVYDYGAVGLTDTLETFRQAGIPTIGAGENIEEASRPFYIIKDGRKYGFTAASRAEKNVLTPEATETDPGILWMYEMDAYLEVIREAEQQCDVNIAYVHWGTEKSNATEAGLYENAVSMIEAGADIVIGAHAHVLQGIDYYRHVPILYNLGNFIFDEETLETAILRLTVDRRGRLGVQILPCLQEDRYTDLLKDRARYRVWNLLLRLSPHISIDDQGIVTEKAD